MFRGRLMQSARARRHAQRAARRPREIEGELERERELDIAAINAPKLCVVSGPEPAIDASSS